MISQKILYAPTPDPATLHEQDEITIIIHEDGNITGDLCKNMTDLLNDLEIRGITTKQHIEFCG